MSDPAIPTVDAAILINAHTSPPTPGTNVWALTHGGVLVKEVWKSDSIRYFDAWCNFPKVPQEVKDIQMARFRKGAEHDSP